MTDNLDTAANPDANQAPQDDKANNDVQPAAAPADNNGASAAPAASGADADKTKPVEDWRVKLANGDEKELKRLARFASEADVWKAYRELEKKKSSGELKNALPEKPTDEELAQWRKENGIPESPDKYELNFDNGLVIGEEDKPFIDQFVNKMHGANATPAQVKAAIATYYEIVESQKQAVAEADIDFKDTSLESLREEWGGDFKKNVNAVAGLLQSAPDEVKEIFDNARTPDGKIIGNHPEIVKWLAQQAFEINPAATVMPNSVSNPGAAIGDEIASIEKMIAERADAYWKNPKAQARYQELLAAREKIAARS